MRKETRCCHIGYSFRLTARVLLYAPSHRQDSTYHGLWYTSHGALAGTRNSFSLCELYVAMRDVVLLCELYAAMRDVVLLCELYVAMRDVVLL